MKIIELPKHERPREKMMERGPLCLKDKELVAILLRTGGNGLNAIELADALLKKFPLKKLLAFEVKDFSAIKGIDAGKACSLLAAFELSRRALAVNDNNLPQVNCAKEAVAHLQELRQAKKEHFVVLYLNARNQLIHKETISIGTLNANLVHPREVYYPAIAHLACAIIVAHNHPSGGTEPSAADLDLTRRLKDCGKLMGIELLDHVIITRNEYFSLNA